MSSTVIPFKFMDICTKLDKETTAKNIKALISYDSFMSMPPDFSGKVNGNKIFIQVRNKLNFLPWRGAFYGRVITNHDQTLVRGEFRPNYALYFFGSLITAFSTILLISGFERQGYIDISETISSLFGITICIVYIVWLINTDRKLIKEAICDAIRGKEV